MTVDTVNDPRQPEKGEKGISPAQAALLVRVFTAIFGKLKSSPMVSNLLSLVIASLIGGGMMFGCLYYFKYAPLLPGPNPLDPGPQSAITIPPEINQDGIGRIYIEAKTLDKDAKVKWHSFDLSFDGRGHEFFGVATKEGTYKVLAATCQNGEPVFAVSTVKVGKAVPEPKPDDPPVKPDVPNKVTAVCYVYEKDQSPVPPGVLAGLNKLNRDKGIVATTFEQDIKNAPGQIPAQYKIPLEAAKKVGLPALVVLNENSVLKTVKDVKTEQQVLEAIK